MKTLIKKKIHLNKKVILRRRKKRNVKRKVKRREIIDYKNQGFVRRFVSEQGKILSRRVSKLTSKHQRIMTKCIKSSRILAFMSFLNNES